MAIYWVDPWKNTVGDGSYANPYTMVCYNPAYPDVIYDCDEFRIKSRLKSELIKATICASPDVETNTPRIRSWQLSDNICSYSNPACFNQTLAVGENGLVSAIGHSGASYDEANKKYCQGYYYSAFPFQHTDWSRPVCFGIIDYQCVPALNVNNTNSTAVLLGGVGKNICICNLGCRFTASDGWISETVRCTDKSALSILAICGSSVAVFGNSLNGQQYCGTISLNHCIDLMNTTIFSYQEADLSLYLPDINTNLLSDGTIAQQLAQTFENKIPSCETTVFKLKNFTNSGMFYHGAISIINYNNFECYPTANKFNTYFLNPQKTIQKTIHIDTLQNGWTCLSSSNILKKSETYTQIYDMCINNLLHGILYGNNLSFYKEKSNKLITNLYVDNLVKYISDPNAQGAAIQINPDVQPYNSIYVDKIKYNTLADNQNKCLDIPNSFGLKVVSTPDSADSGLLNRTCMHYPSDSSYYVSLGNNNGIKNYVPDIFSNQDTSYEKFSVKRNHIFDPIISKAVVGRKPSELILHGQLEINNNNIQVQASADSNYVQIYDYNVDSLTDLQAMINNISSQSVGQYYQNSHGRLNLIINQNHEYKNTIVLGQRADIVLVGSVDTTDSVNEAYSIRFRPRDINNGLYFNPDGYGFDNKFIIAYNVPFNKGLTTTVTGNLKNRLPSQSKIYKIELVHNENTVEQFDVGNTDNWNAFTLKFKSLTDQVGQFRIYLQGVMKPNGYNQVDISLEGLGVNYEL